MSKHLLLISIIALILRFLNLILLEGISTPFIEDSLTYYKIANFADENGILNWQSHERPPLISLIIIPLIKIFPEFLTIILIKVFMILISTINCVIIYILAFEISKNDRIALISGLIFSFYPFSIFLSGRLLTENLASLLISLICFFSIKFFKNENIKSLVTISFLLGLLSLTRSSYYYFPFFLIIIFFFYKTTIMKKLSFILIIFGIFFTTLSPWIIKNYIQLNEFVPTTTRLGVGLWYSNNDFSDPVIKKGGYNKGTFNYKKEIEFTKNLDPIKQSDYLKKKALTEIKKNKIEFLKACVFRFINFFNPKPNPYKNFAFKDLFMIFYFTPFLILFFVGLIKQNYNFNKVILISVIFYTLLVHLPFYGYPRFRFPIDSLIFLLSISFLFEKINDKRFLKFLSKLKFLRE